MSKKIYESKYDCCGCSACYVVCPVNAISMIADDEGFKYPRIDQAVCVNCKKCEVICPLRSMNNNSNPKHIFAAKNKDESVRKKSTSGGIFSLLADYVELQNGVIYGAGFDEKYRVKHMRAESVAEWKKFCGSKYVQSDVNDTFLLVRKDLNNGKTVLFSGTPCQIDGLKKYLKSMTVSYDNLITCDIVCHGTPSPKVWEDYLKYLTRRTNRRIGFVSFRDKEEYGWHNSTLTIKDKKNQVILLETKKNNFFFQLFSNHEILRPSCHKCKYASFYRPGDITLGDFWGIEKNFAQFDDDKGVSLVMVNSEKGVEIWKQIQNGSEYFKVLKEQCVQPNLSAPSKESTSRENFWRWYNKYGFKRIGQRMGYIPVNMAEKLLIFIYRCENKLKNCWKRN